MRLDSDQIRPLCPDEVLVHAFHVKNLFVVNQLGSIIESTSGYLVRTRSRFDNGTDDIALREQVQRWDMKPLPPGARFSYTAPEEWHEEGWAEYRRIDRINKARQAQRALEAGGQRTIQQAIADNDIDHTEDLEAEREECR